MRPLLVISPARSEPFGRFDRPLPRGPGLSPRCRQRERSGRHRQSGERRSKAQHYEKSTQADRGGMHPVATTAARPTLPVHMVRHIDPGVASAGVIAAGGQTTRGSAAPGSSRHQVGSRHRRRSVRSQPGARTMRATPYPRYAPRCRSGWVAPRCSRAAGAHHRLSLSPRAGVERRP